MKQLFRAAVVGAAILAVPAMSLAAQTPAMQPKAAATAGSARTPAKATKPARTAVRSAQGVVKSMDASTLVLAEKSGKKGNREVRFVLDPAVQKDSAVAVGSNVQVKYHNDAKQHVVTEIRPASGRKS